MYTEDYKFSERLKTLRKSKKLTQVQISELIEFNKGHILGGRMER